MMSVLNDAIMAKPLRTPAENYNQRRLVFQPEVMTWMKDRLRNSPVGSGVWVRVRVARKPILPREG